MQRTPPRIPLNFYAIPFGLLGLADCWLVAASFGLAPVALGRVLVALAVVVWVVVVISHLRGLRAHQLTLAADLLDPIAGPFASLAILTPLLAAADFYPLIHTTGTVIVDILIVATVLLSGWFTGQWIYGSHDFAKVHPGYFLPGVAGGFVASACAGLVGQLHLAEMLFGLGLLSWVMIGSVVLGRLIVGPPLPAPLLPTIAIQVAPGGVATFAAFVLNHGHVDSLVRILAGYGLLMVIAQARLLPAYLRLPFMPSFWAFTFPWAAVAFAGLFWLGATQPSGWRAESYASLALISGLVVAIAARTVIALRCRNLLAPAVAPALAAQPALDAREAIASVRS